MHEVSKEADVVFIGLMSPEEAAMAQGGLGGPPGMGGPGLEANSPPPDVQTILSRLTGGGQAEGGAQTVGTNVGP